MENSILNEIKHLLGIIEEDTTFDSDIILLINGALSTLTQLGVGPAVGYQITDASNIWAEFCTDLRLNSAKTYIYIEVKMVHDAENLSGPVLSAMERQKTELQYRLNVTADYG